MYPNPVSSDYFTIALPIEFDGAAISVMNLQGQSVINSTFHSTGEEQKIYVGNVAEGMYLVSTIAGGGKGGLCDGRVEEAMFNLPQGICVDIRKNIP